MQERERLEFWVLGSMREGGGGILVWISLEGQLIIDKGVLYIECGQVEKNRGRANLITNIIIYFSTRLACLVQRVTS